jgi:hypothetical protein
MRKLTYIVARRVSEDVYECSAPGRLWTQTLSWEKLGGVTEDECAFRVTERNPNPSMSVEVLNAGQTGLPRIVYFVSFANPLCQMPPPSLAEFEHVPYHAAEVMD